jgi:hypothetical protein
VTAVGCVPMIADILRMLTTRYNADVRWWRAAVLLYACGTPAYGPTPSTPRDAALESGTASDATALTPPATDAGRAGELGDRSTVRLATFNIQVFGKTKASKPEIMAQLAAVIRQYDVIRSRRSRTPPATRPGFCLML